MKCTIYKVAVIGPLLAALASCYGSTAVVGRYDKCESDGAACNKKESNVDVSIVFSPAVTPQTSGKTGTDLSDGAQAAYISALSQKSKTVEDLRNNLAAAIGRGGELAAARDSSLIYGSLIITVSDVGPFNPADRIERTEVEIKLDNAKIHSWSAVQTAYTIVNAGTIKSSLQKGGELGVTASSPNLPVGITGKASIQNSISDELTVSQRVEDVTPIFNPNDGTINIIRHGGFGLNLTGNTILNASFQPDPGSVASPEFFSIKSTKDKNGNWLPPHKLEFDVKTIKLPRGVGDIKGTITLTYTLRHVIKGDDTYQERDDSVEERTYTKTQSNITLIPAENVGPLTFGLYSASNGQPLYVRRVFRHKDSPFCFESYESAQNFSDYLNRPHAMHPEILGTAQLGFSGPGATGNSEFSDIDMASIKTLSVQPGCQPS
jgi:hypothetical protein